MKQYFLWKRESQNCFCFRGHRAYARHKCLGRVIAVHRASFPIATRGRLHCNMIQILVSDFFSIVVLFDITNLPCLFCAFDHQVRPRVNQQLYPSSPQTQESFPVALSPLLP